MRTENFTDQEAAEFRQWGLLDSVFQGSPIASFVIDLDHRVVLWNRAAEIVTGMPAAGLLGTHNQWQAFYPEPRPVLADLIVAGDIQKALATYEAGHCRQSRVVQGAYEAEGFFPHLGPQGRWLLFTAAPIFDAEGSMIGALETLQDISEAKRIEEQLRDQQAQLEERVRFATSSAMTAMSSMGEMGVVLQTFQKFNGCQTLSDVCAAVLEGLRQYELVATVLARGEAGSCIETSAAHSAEQDAVVFDSLSNMGRLIHFRSRLIVNYERVSLILHNVPWNDDEKAGRIRDNVAMLVEAADARVAAISAEKSRNSSRQAIHQTAEHIGVVLDSIRQRQQESLTAGSLAIHDMLTDMEKLFIGLGLTERQEKQLLELVQEGLERISASQAGLVDVQAGLADIIRSLGKPA